MLSLEFNRIGDLTLLADLKNLEKLFLGGNQIDDLTPLADLKNLETLGLRDNRITDLTPLTQLTNLRWLRLDGNQIEDISSLVANTALGEGDAVILIDNPLSDQALNEQIPALEARGVTVTY